MKTFGCALCKFFAQAKEINGNPLEYGECRRNAPIAGGHDRDAVWPFVGLTAFCGDGRPKAKGEA